MLARLKIHTSGWFVPLFVMAQIDDCRLVFMHALPLGWADQVSGEAMIWDDQVPLFAPAMIITNHFPGP